jgi:hypothetical protein
MNPTAKTGYWTEGKIDPKTNIMGTGTFVQGTPPTNTTAPIGNSPINTTFNGSALGNTTAQIVPTTTPTVGSNPVVSNPPGTTLDANGFAVMTPVNNAPTKEKSFYDKAMEMLNSDITTLGTKSTVTEDLQKEQQLQAKRDMATASYNTYNKEQTLFNQQLANMQNAEANTVGAVGGGFSSSIQKFDREGRARLANLSIQANMDANNLTAAQQNIKDKLDAQFQPVQDRIDNIGKYIQLNNADLTDKEKFDLTNIQNTKQKEKDNLTKIATDLHQAVLDNGNPPGVLESLDKVTKRYDSGVITANQAQAEYFNAAGKYGGDMTRKLDIDYKQAQIDKLKMDATSGADMTPGQATMFNGIVNKYNASPLVKASNRTVTLRSSIDDARKDPSDGAKQLNLNYSYIQALDTYQSAVREGELKLTNSIDSKVGKLGNAVEQITNGQIVRPEVIKQMADAAESLLKAIDGGAKTAEASYKSQANVVGLDKQWDKYISGFKQIYNSNDSTPSIAPEVQSVLDKYSVKL